MIDLKARLAEIDPSVVATMSDEERLELLELIEKAEQLERENKLAQYAPYAKQRDFHNAQSRERLFMAGNQIGKTFASANEIAYHATGLYPDWWEGRRFTAPTVGWAAGVTGESTRDTLQRLTMGRAGNWGTGSIPKHLIVGAPTMARGVADLIDFVAIRHKGGGESLLYFKSYEKGREKWQGETLDYVAYDEEPPLDIYTEGLTRTNTTRGIVWITATPLLGATDVIKRFLIDKAPGTTVINATIDDAEHYTPEEREAIVASYPEHEREARAKGIPSMGSGRVFPIAEDVLKIEPFQIPAHWARIAGLDFGFDHPTAVVWLAWDRDNDVIYVTDCHRQRQATPVLHAAAIKMRSDWIPVAWPHDGLQHDKGGSGEQLAKQYKDQGVPMLPNRATFEDGTNGVEAGISDMLIRMQTGRLRVFSHLNEWFEEFRMYHRKNGIIVKIDDDLMSATRYALMMRRFAKTGAEAARNRPAQSRNSTLWMFDRPSAFGVLDPVVNY